MKVDIGLTKSKTLKEVVQVGHNSVRSLRNEMDAINEEVHLSREPLTAHAKDAALPRNKEVQWAWLHRVTRLYYSILVFLLQSDDVVCVLSSGFSCSSRSFRLHSTSSDSRCAELSSSVSQSVRADCVQCVSRGHSFQ